MQNFTLVLFPPVRGKYTENAALGTVGWFKCGGTAEMLFKPADEQDLAEFLKTCPSDIPVTTFGVLSNTIIRDGGLRGVTIRLGREFTAVKHIDRHPGQAQRAPGPSSQKPEDPGSSRTLARDDDILIEVGAALLDTHLATYAAENGITGLEFLGGIPGTIGGALRMNAGAVGAAYQAGGGDTYGQTSMRDVLVAATALDRQGNIHTVTPDEMHMTYRHTQAPADWIFTSCILRGTKDTPENVMARMAALKERREAAQPVREKTGGSTFANPTPDELVAAGLPTTTRCWQLIDRAGCRNLTIGGAQMSEKHCNFMINTGTATAYDLESLGELVRKKVYDSSGITLRWEIKRIGDFSPTQEPIIPFDKEN